jgi:cytochrome c oxidase subunit 2
MPTYQGQVSEEGLIDLVEYIKNLNSNYRIQQTLTASQLSTGQAGASSSGPASAPMNYHAGPAKSGTAAPRVPGTVKQ